MVTLKPCCVHNESGKASWALPHKCDHTTAGATSHVHQGTKGKGEQTGKEEEKLGGGVRGRERNK